MIGLVALLLVSFMYTEKTVSVIKENDDVMVEIRNVADSYYVSPIEAIINNDEITPGLSGKEVNINKSYNKMKKLGSFNENLLIFDDIKPKQRLQKNLDKYVVSGNKNKNMVSLIFLVYDNSDIDSVINILEKRNTKAAFFIDGNWLEKNNNKLQTISKTYEIGNISYNGDYTDASFPWIDIVIKNVINQGYSYCLLEEKNKEYLDVCALNTNMTIKPNIYIESNGLYKVKNDLVGGSLIAIEINNNTILELNNIISYIESKGYKIESLKEHLKE